MCRPWDWEMCLQDPGAAAAQALGTEHPPGASHHTPPSSGVAPFRTDSQPSRSSSTSGTFGQCPQLPPGPELWELCGFSLWGQRENFSWLCPVTSRRARTRGLVKPT